jgi:hypothetical protein
VRSRASSAALSKIQAAEEHLKEQDAIAEQLDKLAMEELDLEGKRAAEAVAAAATAAAAVKRKREDLLLKAKKRDFDHQLKDSDLQKEKSAPWFFSSIKFSSRCGT